MRHDRPRRTSILIATFALASIGLPAFPASAAEPWTWTYSLAAGLGPGYKYRINEYSFGRYPQSFGPGLAVAASAARRVTRHTSLVLEGGYHGYAKDLALHVFPELPLATGRLRAEHFGLGAGMRLEPWTDPARPVRLYVQFVPALFVSRWEERIVHHDGYDFWGNWRPRTTHTDSFHSALPGFSASAGFRMSISRVLAADIQFRLARSADLGEHALGRFSSGDFRGLDEVAIVTGLAWSP